MRLSVTAIIGLSLMVSLSACGDSCNSLKGEIEQIGREVQKNPASAMSRTEELQSLTNKMAKLGCLS